MGFAIQATADTYHTIPVHLYLLCTPFFLTHHRPEQILGFFRGKRITRFFVPANANGNTVSTK